MKHIAELITRLHLTKVETRVIQIGMGVSLTLRYGVIPTTFEGVLMSVVCAITGGLLEASLRKGGK